MKKQKSDAQRALEQAKKLLRQVKVKPGILKNSAVVYINDRMDIVPMPIRKFLSFIESVPSIKVQRNDLYRTNHGLAKHLDEFALPQGVFALVFFDGKFYLVDGNHRRRSWLANPLRAKPSMVWVTIMVVDSLEEGRDIYDCYDSSEAKKNKRDELMSLIHEAGAELDTFRSPTVAGGKLVTVINCMTRALSGSTASRRRKAEVVKDHLQCFAELDKHMFNEAQVVGGALWALMRLYRQVPKEHYKYIDEFATELKKLGTENEHMAERSLRLTRSRAVRDCLKKGYGTSGEKPMPIMFPHYMRGFATWAQARIRARRTDAAFKRFVEKNLMSTCITPDIQRAARLVPQEAKV